MIYSIIWNRISGFGSGYSPIVYAKLMNGDSRAYPALQVAERIRKNEKDSFVFILTRNQMPQFKWWVEKEELTPYIAYRSKYLYNANYPEHGPKLMLFIFQSPNHRTVKIEHNVLKEVV